MKESNKKTEDKRLYLVLSINSLKSMIEEVKKHSFVMSNKPEEQIKKGITTKVFYYETSKKYPTQLSRIWESIK